MAIPGSFQYPQAQAPGLPAPVTGSPATPGPAGVGAGQDWWRALLEQLGITLPEGVQQPGRGFNFRTANRQPRPAPQFTGVPRSIEGGYTPAAQTAQPVRTEGVAPSITGQFAPVTPKNGIYLPEQQSRTGASWLSNYLRG